MIVDLHLTPEHWGLMPVLFRFGGLAVPAYSFFVGLGLFSGLLLYLYDFKRYPIARSGNGLPILLSALFFGTLGAKLPMWLAYHDLWLRPHGAIMLLLTGKTIVGGLIGGFMGVSLAKRLLKIKDRWGNRFAPALALGLAIGRIGCLFQGCCYGMVTALPWGLDFGDGLHRHPTQLYEILFHLSALVWLRLKRAHQVPGGLYLRLYFICYFIYRFFSEFLRTEPRWFMGLTAYQWAALLFSTFLIWTCRKAFKASAPENLPYCPSKGDAYEQRTP